MPSRRQSVSKRLHHVYAPHARADHTRARTHMRLRSDVRRFGKNGEEARGVRNMMPHESPLPCALALPQPNTQLRPPNHTSQRSRAPVVSSRESKPRSTSSSMGSPTAKAALFLSASTLLMQLPPATPFLLPAHPGEIEHSSSHRCTSRLGACFQQSYVAGELLFCKAQGEHGNMNILIDSTFFGLPLALNNRNGSCRYSSRQCLPAAVHEPCVF